MGWEQRGSRRYYYRKKRRAGKVRSEYIGAGPVAELWASIDESEHQEHAVKRNADRRTRQAEAEIDRQLDDLESAIVSITAATLCAAGFHNHKGQWRKKRP